VVTTFSSFRFPSSARLVGGVTILDLSGRILAGDGSAALRDLVSKLISEGNKKILLNLGNVNYIDSSGLGELMTAFTSMRSQGGELKLLNLTKRVRDLMQITKLYTVFDITDDEATSIKSFSPSISPPSLVEPNWLYQTVSRPLLFAGKVSSPRPLLSPLNQTADLRDCEAVEGRLSVGDAGEKRKGQTRWG